MDAWKEDFIAGLRAGKSEAYLAKTLAGQPLAFVQGLRDTDVEFGVAWDEALSYAASLATSRQLTAAALEKVLNAQVPDERAAAYFGMKVPEFRAAVEASADLKRVYEVAREAGLALVEMQIHGEALQGNWQATHHFAKHKLGQSDNAGAPAPVNVTFNISNPGESYRQLLGGGSLVLPDIEGTSELVDEGNKVLEGYPWKA